MLSNKSDLDIVCFLRRSKLTFYIYYSCLFLLLLTHVICCRHMHGAMLVSIVFKCMYNSICCPGSHAPATCRIQADVANQPYYCNSYSTSTVVSTVLIQWWLQYEPNSMKMIFSTNEVGSF
jgi:hypothetical protein